MSALIGAHAATRKHARIQALREFGIDPDTLMQMDPVQKLAQAARVERERALVEEHDTFVV
jgi:hypothetical protein